VPLGSLANASSVGANTVKGPLPLSVSTRPGGLQGRGQRVELPAATAVSTMSLSPIGTNDAFTTPVSLVHSAVLEASHPPDACLEAVHWAEHDFMLPNKGAEPRVRLWNVRRGLA
jgi:hypothetical protein